MHVSSESAEHSFLTFLEGIKADLDGWVAITYSFSQFLNYDDILSDRDTVQTKLEKESGKSHSFLAGLKDCFSEFDDITLYHFDDFDIVLTVHVDTEDQLEKLQKIYEKISIDSDRKLDCLEYIADDFKKYQKYSDEKFIMAKRMQALRSLIDNNKISSISLRRSRRDDPVIMVVEDDRFTASYASHILRDFDIIICRKGEDAIPAYIEHAPDIVFMDIHLPGFTGHQTLQSILCADPDAYVLMLSVDSVKENIDQSKMLGSKGFLKKPVSRERVLNTIRACPFIRNKKGILPYEGTT